jgi:hypothetical protein
MKYFSLLSIAFIISVLQCTPSNAQTRYDASLGIGYIIQQYPGIISKGRSVFVKPTFGVNIYKNIYVSASPFFNFQKYTSANVRAIGGETSFLTRLYYVHALDKKWDIMAGPTCNIVPRSNSGNFAGFSLLPNISDLDLTFGANVALAYKVHKSYGIYADVFLNPKAATLSSLFPYTLLAYTIGLRKTGLLLK